MNDVKGHSPFASLLSTFYRILVQQLTRGSYDSLLQYAATCYAAFAEFVMLCLLIYILVIFGRDVAERVCHRMTIYYPTSPVSNVSALTGEI